VFLCYSNAITATQLQQRNYSNAITVCNKFKKFTFLTFCVLFLTILSLHTVVKGADCEGSSVPCDVWSEESSCDFTVPLPLGSLPPGTEPCIVRAIYKIRRCGDEVEVQILRYEYIDPVRPECRTAFNHQIQNNGTHWQKQVWFHSNLAIMKKEFMSFYTQLPQNLRSAFECPNGVKRFYAYQAGCMKHCAYMDAQNQVMVLIPKKCFGGKCCKMVSEICYNSTTQSIQSTETIVEISVGTLCVDDTVDGACPLTYSKSSTTGGTQTLNLDTSLNFPCFSNCE
jgi:hypothetical protein